ncbi:hypothetical protein ABZM97_02970 [Bacillus vallismortis]|uniref:hypothetical protein n=1 Tax=Bacillus vallismortis TaxID=72361 RepID=UPI0034608438
MNGTRFAYQFTLLLEGTTSMTTLIGAEKATEYSIAMARTIIPHISSCFSLNMSFVHSARPYG